VQALIHPTAVIDPGAELHPTVQVGPYATIGERVRIGADTTIGAHAIIEGPSEIGAGNRIFPGAAIGLEPQDLKYRGAQSGLWIGDGNWIREYVTINRATGEEEATQIGHQNLLMAYVHVAHNCQIEDSTILANNVALSGHVCIESNARISGMLGIHQFVRIGRLAMVGGMSRIDRDVPPYTVVEGNPARVRSLHAIGLKRAGFAASERRRLKQAFRILYRSGTPFTQALEQLEPLSDSDSVRYLQQFIQHSLSPERRGLTPGKLKAGDGAAE